MVKMHVPTLGAPSIGGWGLSPPLPPSLDIGDLINVLMILYGLEGAVVSLISNACIQIWSVETMEDNKLLRATVGSLPTVVLIQLHC